MSKLRKFLHRNIYPMFFYWIPLKENKIVFSSYAGKQYSGNSKAISDKLHELYPKSDIVWIFSEEFKDFSSLPSYVRIVQSESLAAAFELFTAKVWVDNMRKPLFFKRREKQYYIQTWHGTPLKLIEDDAKDKLGARYQMYADRDNLNMTTLVSGNEYSSSIYKRAFKFDGEILESGTPRNDVLINHHKEIAAKVSKRLSLSDKNVVLFAPTFRNDVNKNGMPQLNQLNPKELLKALDQKYKGNFVLLLRFHPNVAAQIDKESIIKKYGDRIYDVSIGWEMQDLLCVSDVLITDYSSVFFDFAILNRPIFLFTPDLEEYCEERGLYLALNDLPILSSKTSKELVQQILSESVEASEKNTQELLNFLGNKEKGTASKEIANKIAEYMNL